MIYYTPKLDQLIKSQELPVVPYRIHDGQKPEVGHMYWSYRKNNYFVVTETYGDGTISITWSQRLKKETVRNDIPINLELRPLEVDFYEFSGRNMISPRKFFDTVKLNGTRPTPMKGAEIKALCCMGVFDLLLEYFLTHRYFSNNANSKIDDDTRYLIKELRPNSYDAVLVPTE